MKYEPGEAVLLSHVTGGSLDQPQRAVILKSLPTSRVYSYAVTCDDRVMNVREDWMCPADILIQEVPDTPFD